MTIALVSCVKMKADTALPARDLYISPWFIMARQYVEKRADRWFILSAEHGLLNPDTVIEPYEQSLTSMNTKARYAWSDKVMTQANDARLAGGNLIVLAGLHYRLGLMPFLHNRFLNVEVPMRGMKLGEQLSFLIRDSGF